MATLEKHVKRNISTKALKVGTDGKTLPTGRVGHSEAMDSQMDYSKNANKKRGGSGKGGAAVGTGLFKGLKGA